MSRAPTWASPKAWPQDLASCAWAIVTLAFASVSTSDPQFKTYPVDQQVRRFTGPEDYSTPEAAHATIERLLSQGDTGCWRRASVQRLAKLYPERNARAKGPKEPGRLEATILEVRRLDQRVAVVLARGGQDPVRGIGYHILESATSTTHWEIFFDRSSPS